MREKFGRNAHGPARPRPDSGQATDARLLMGVPGAGGHSSALEQQGQQPGRAADAQRHVSGPLENRQPHGGVRALRVPAVRSLLQAGQPVDVANGPGDRDGDDAHAAAVHVCVQSVRRRHVAHAQDRRARAHAHARMARGHGQVLPRHQGARHRRRRQLRVVHALLARTRVRGGRLRAGARVSRDHAPRPCPQPRLRRAHHPLRQRRVRHPRQLYAACALPSTVGTHEEARCAARGAAPAHPHAQPASPRARALSLILSEAGQAASPCPQVVVLPPDALATSLAWQA